jgi:uncharacterized membrane protein
LKKSDVEIKKSNIEDIEIIISKSLQVGVLLSAIVMLAGFLMFILTGHSGYENNTFPSSLPMIMQGLVAFKPYAIILTGLFFLILTPVFRVGVSIIVFLKEKDFLYVAITAIVFSILIVSFLLGKVE